jgi:putative colanic acid biosynthesis acetyltransferase WcaF
MPHTAPKSAAPPSRAASRAHYNAALHIPASTARDPYLRPAFPLRNRLRRQLWNLVWLLLYRPSPRPLHRWRAALLRLFGAQLGPNCHFYPSSRIWAPWNLICRDQVTAGEDAQIYNPAPITLGSHALLSQEAYLCGATHDYNDPAFPLLAFTMQLGAYAWVGARASVAPGVNLGDGAVLGLGSVATRDLEPWSVYAGTPAVKIKARARSA